MIDKNVSLIEKDVRQKRDNRIFSVLFFIVMWVLLLSMVFNTFIYSSIYVDGDSMYPTLCNGDIVKVNKTLRPTYGDVVIIKKEKINVVKRVVAMGGDSVKLKDGDVYIKKSGEEDYSLLVESYLGDEVRTSPDAWTEIYVPIGCVLYFGDNRIVSEDSRTNGYCNINDVIGVVEPWIIKTKNVRTWFFNVFGI